MCFSKSIFVKILEKFGEVFDSTFENWKLEKEKGFVKKKRESSSQPSSSPASPPHPALSLSPILPSFSHPTPCCPRIRSNPNGTRANPSPRTILFKLHLIRSSSAPKTLAKRRQAAVQELEPLRRPPPVKPELRPSIDDSGSYLSSLSPCFIVAQLLDIIALFLSSPDRRIRACRPRTAATSISDEQSPEEEEPPERTTSPPTPPRHADQRGEIRVSWNTIDCRERSCRAVATARRRPSEP